MRTRPWRSRPTDTIAIARRVESSNPQAKTLRASLAGPPWQAEPIRQNDLRTSMISSGKDSVMKSARLLNRREFNGLCGALGSFVASSGSLALDAATAVALNGTAQTV